MLLLVSFNPCCIGRYAKRLISCLDEGQGLSFNPCCIGRYAKSWSFGDTDAVEYSFNPCCIGRYAKRAFFSYATEIILLFQSLLYWKIC